MAGRNVTTIGVTGGTVKVCQNYKPIADYLTRELGRPFEIVNLLNDEDTFNSAGNGSVDFMLSNPTTFECIQVQFSAGGVLSVVRNVTGEPVEDQGAGIVVLDGRSDIQTLADVRGKRVATARLTQLQGFQAQWGEFLAEGIPFFQTPAQLQLAEGGQAQIDSLLNGNADVAFTGINVTVASPPFRTLAPRLDPDFPFPTSTVLYPESLLYWVGSDSDSDLLRGVQSALLALQPGALELQPGMIWYFRSAYNYGTARTLLQNLNMFVDLPGGQIRCRQMGDIYDLVTCEAGFMKLPPAKLGMACQMRGLPLPLRELLPVRPVCPRPRGGPRPGDRYPRGRGRGHRHRVRLAGDAHRAAHPAVRAGDPLLAVGLHVPRLDAKLFRTGVECAVRDRGGGQNGAVRSGGARQVPGRGGDGRARMPPPSAGAGPPPGKRGRGRGRTATPVALAGAAVAGGLPDAAHGVPRPARGDRAPDQAAPLQPAVRAGRVPRVRRLRGSDRARLLRRHTSWGAAEPDGAVRDRDVAGGRGRHRERDVVPTPRGIARSVWDQAAARRRVHDARVPSHDTRRTHPRQQLQHGLLLPGAAARGAVQLRGRRVRVRHAAVRADPPPGDVRQPGDERWRA